MYELGGRFDDTEVAPGTNILLSGPPLSGKTAIGYELLEAGGRRNEGAIIVSNNQSASRIRTERPELFGYDAPIGIIDCVTKHQGNGTITDTEFVQYAASPEDMTGVGIKFSELLEQFYAEGTRRTRSLFVSISTLLMYADLQTVFRFLHVFTTRIEDADTLGLFVVQSEAHDPQTMNTLSQLFDGVIQTAADGTVTVNLS